MLKRIKKMIMIGFVWNPIPMEQNGLENVGIFIN